MASAITPVPTTASRLALKGSTVAAAALSCGAAGGREPGTSVMRGAYRAIGPGRAAEVGSVDSPENAAPFDPS